MMDDHVETERLDNTVNLCSHKSVYVWCSVCHSLSHTMGALVRKHLGKCVYYESRLIDLGHDALFSSLAYQPWCVCVAVYISVCLISATMGVHCKTGYQCFLQQRLSLGHTHKYTHHLEAVKVANYTYS